MRFSRRFLAVAAVMIACTAAVPGSAAGVQLALPLCAGNTEPRELLSGAGALEAVLADPDGERLYLTDLAGGRVLVLDSPDAEPRTLARLNLPAGLAWAPDGRLLVGYNQFFGQTGGPPALTSLDPRTGASKPVADHLNGANGIAVAADGTVYTSGGTFSEAIDRIGPDGTVTRRWASMTFANGIQLDPSGRYLYGTRVFPSVGIQRVEFAGPGAAQLHFAAPGLDGLQPAAIDGLDIDPSGRLYAASYLRGEAWRIAADGRSGCVLARDPRFIPTASIGHGRGAGDFPSTSAYVVSHTGFLFELPDAVR